MGELETKKFIYGAIFLLANRLQALGDKNDEIVTTKQYFLLVTLDQFRDHEPTLTEMSHFMACSRQNCKKMAVILQAKGMLTLMDDPSDARSMRLALTEQGKEYIRKRSVTEEERYNQLFDNISDTALEYLKNGMLLLAANLARMEASEE